MAHGETTSSAERERLVRLCEEVGYEAASARTGRSVKGLRELAARHRRAERKGATV